MLMTLNLKISPSYPASQILREILKLEVVLEARKMLQISNRDVIIIIDQIILSVSTFRILRVVLQSC